MLNAPQPKPEDLPTLPQLRRSSLIAIVAAAAIGVAVVLPAEYAIDPTGVGGPTGLREMGEIKQQLAAEAEQDHGDAGELLSPKAGPASLFGLVGGLLVGEAKAQSAGTAWTDEATFTLEPGASYEIKLSMREAAIAEYEWTASGGVVNFDLHAHAGGKEASYKRGRGAASDRGALTAEFDGDHGWFFRNRDSQPVTITLSVRGDYSELKRDL